MSTSPTDNFWGRAALPYRHVAADPAGALARSELLVRLTYVLWVFFALDALRGYRRYAAPPDELLWPNTWMAALDWDLAVGLVLGVFLVGTLLAAAAPRVRTFRVLAIVGILAAEGLKYSFEGKINHGYHLWTLIALLLVFLPRGDREDDAWVRSYLEIAWGAQALVLSTYTIAGLQKLWGAWLDLGENGITVFDPSSLALQVAKVVVRGEGGGLLAPFLLDNPRIGGPLMVGALGLELLALAVFFRPRAQRVWAVALIAMHVGIGLVLDVWFEPQILVVGVWLLASPFAPTRQHAWSTVFELPIVGRSVAALWARLRRAPTDVVDVQNVLGPVVEHRRGDDEVVVAGPHAVAWLDVVHGRRTMLGLTALALPTAAARRLVHPAPPPANDGSPDDSERSRVPQSAHDR